MFRKSVKTTVFAEPLCQADLGAGGGAPAGDGGGSPAPNTTSSIIPGDNYASGGPEAPENQPAELIDFEGFDINAEPEEGEGKGDPADPTTATGDPEPDPVPDPVKKEQSPEANAAFAEIRRQAEQAQRELQARDAWVEQTFGVTHNLHTFEQYQQAIEATRQQEALQKQQEIQTRPAQVAQETYQQLIAAGYDDAAAREIANAKGAAEAANLQLQALQNEVSGIKTQTKQEKEQAQLQAAEAQKQAAAQQIMQTWEAERAKLQQEYGDLVPANLEQIDPVIVDKLKKGYSFEDAWYTTNRPQIVEQREKAAAQKTLNNLDSKKHLKTEGDGGADGNASSIPLPNDTLQMYMDSGMSEKQARAFHKKLYG